MEGIKEGEAESILHDLLLRRLSQVQDVHCRSEHHEHDDHNNRELTYAFERQIDEAYVECCFLKQSEPVKEFEP